MPACSRARGNSVLASHDPQSLFHIPSKCVKGAIERGFLSHADQLEPGRKALAVHPVGFAKPSADPVAPGRPAHLAGNGKPNPAGPIAPPPEKEQRRSLDTLAEMEDRLELFPPPQPFGPGNPVTSRPPGHTSHARRSGAYAPSTVAA